MRSFRVFLALAMFVPALALAQGGDLFRVQAAWTDPSGDLTDEEVKIEADDAFGPRFAWEHLFTERFGLELGVSTADHDLIASFPGGSLTAGDVRMTPFTALANFHLTPTAQVDFFVGVGAAYVTFGDVTVRFPGEPAEKFSVDEDFTWAAQVGLDVPFGDRWGLAFSAMYLDAEADAEGDVLPVEPWVAAAGLVFRR